MKLAVRTATGLHTFDVAIEPDGADFHAYVPALPGCHTFGPTPEDALKNLQEAIGLHVAGMEDDGAWSTKR